MSDGGYVGERFVVEVIVFDRSFGFRFVFFWVLGSVGFIFGEGWKCLEVSFYFILGIILVCK